MRRTPAEVWSREEVRRKMLGLWKRGRVEMKDSRAEKKRIVRA